uniref:Uncharacterized protein n=1 Tax=Avena sativa TaxID=4498 RepID=A0ACD5ZC56_AVESA
MAEAIPVSKWSLLPGDLIREIFARAGYDEPLHIFQVACSCKDLFEALSDPGYAHRLRKNKVAPVVLGFFHNRDGLPTFVATRKSPFLPVDAPDRLHWRVIDCRHNKVLFLSRHRGQLGRHELLVWDPVTGAQRRVLVPAEAADCIHPGAAVVCDMPGCIHSPTCTRSGEFRIALVYSAPDEFEGEDEGEEGADMQLRCLLYSSESDAWDDEGSVHGLSDEEFGMRPSVMAGGCLYFLSDGLRMFELDLADHSLTRVDLPYMEDWSSDIDDSLILMAREDGLPGLVETTKGALYTWSRGSARWKMTLKFDHYYTFGTVGLRDQSLLGFAEGTSTFFVSSSEGMFSFELPRAMVNDPEELKVELHQKKQCPTSVYPVVSLYTPYKVIRQGLQQNGAEQPLDQANPNEAAPRPPAEEPCPKRIQKSYSSGGYMQTMDGQSQDLGMHSSAEPDPDC